MLDAPSRARTCRRPQRLRATIGAGRTVARRTGELAERRSPRTSTTAAPASDLSSRSTAIRAASDSTARSRETMRTCSRERSGREAPKRAPARPIRADRISRLLDDPSTCGVGDGRDRGCEQPRVLRRLGDPVGDLSHGEARVPRSHSTTNGVSTKRRVQSACGHSSTSTTDRSRAVAARTSSSSAAVGSPAMMCTSTSASARGGPVPTTTAPASAPAPSSFASCSARTPLTTIGPGRAGATSSVRVCRRLRSSPTTAMTFAGFTWSSDPARLARECSAERRSARGSRPWTSLRPSRTARGCL